jgi:hypothetical protein
MAPHVGEQIHESGFASVDNVKLIALSIVVGIFVGILVYLGRWQPFGKSAVDDILPTWLLRALGFGSNPNAGHVAGPGAGIRLPFLAISSRMDEAWQLLHGMCSFRNPLAVDISLAKYLFGSLQKRMSLGEKIDAILGGGRLRRVVLSRKQL